MKTVHRLTLTADQIEDIFKDSLNDLKLVHVNYKNSKPNSRMLSLYFCEDSTPIETEPNETWYNIKRITYNQKQ